MLQGKVTPILRKLLGPCTCGTPLVVHHAWCTMHHAWCKMHVAPCMVYYAWFNMILCFPAKNDDVVGSWQKDFTMVLSVRKRFRWTKFQLKPSQSREFGILHPGVIRWICCSIEGKRHLKAQRPAHVTTTQDNT